MPLGSQPIAHTHPTKNSMQRWPSNADMRFINNYHFNYQLILNPSSPTKPHTIIWGDSPGQNTVIYPSVNKEPLPKGNPHKRKNQVHGEEN